MKRNYSMPKMNLIEINNRLSRLKAVNKPRLEFPTKIQSKKHYFQYQGDHVVLAHERQQSSNPKNRVRNNLDISDIEGARPKLIQKQKNVMNYYHNKNQEYNPFVPMEVKIMKSLSQPKLPITPTKKYQANQPDALDVFKRQMQNKLIINPQNRLPPLHKHQLKRQVTEPTMAYYESDILSKKIPTEIRSPIISQNYKMHSPASIKPFERKNIVSNPTFLSNFVLL